VEAEEDEDQAMDGRESKESREEDSDSETEEPTNEEGSNPRLGLESARSPTRSQIPNLHFDQWMYSSPYITMDDDTRWLDRVTMMKPAILRELNWTPRARQSNDSPISTPFDPTGKLSTPRLPSHSQLDREEAHFDVKANLEFGSDNSIQETSSKFIDMDPEQLRRSSNASVLSMIPDENIERMMTSLLDQPATQP
jgi:hypothetical protein